MEQIECTVEKIIYRSEENGYCVASCARHKKLSFQSEVFTATGIMPDIESGIQLKLEGVWKIHERYGEQFTVSGYEEIMPDTLNGVRNYLCSGRIKGIGPVLAKKIVSAFGKDALHVIEKEPEKLLSINGVGDKKLAKILESWASQREVKNIMVFLSGLGVSPNLAGKIHARYKQESIKIVKENPYRLADELWGVGFKTADGIAMALGFEKNCYFRLRSGLLYALNEKAGAGHCYVQWNMLIQDAQKILELEEIGEIEITLDDMVKNESVIKESEDGAVWLPYLYYSEDGCAKRFVNLMKVPKQSSLLTEDILGQVQTGLSVEYNENQMLAIRTALNENVMVLTGGPGTGKTTTTLGLITAFERAGKDILLAAPTGRASKRLSEATGMKAKTIHRLLEYKSDGTFGKNENEKLDGDVLIVDECSMIDIVLMNSLLKAIPSGMSLILVGDVDQLPSVGPGNVLKDIINSGCVPVVRLTEIFRQAQGSRIIMNAHRINKGQMIEIENSDAGSDFFFSEVKGDSDDNDEINRIIARRIVNFAARKLPAYYHVDPLRDIQVLAPQKKGVCGTIMLNSCLQKALNPESPALKRGSVEFRLRDKVIQMKNNYDKGVFNGDIGIITKVDKELQTIAVVYGDSNDDNNCVDENGVIGNIVYYSKDELDELEPAYAITIHKSQGSECPVVLIPLTMSNYMMLYRNLLYTGVTRAKKILVLVGEKRALRRAVRNVDTAARNSKLSMRVRRIAENCGLIAPAATL